jgi:hypothetical protein
METGETVRDPLIILSLVGAGESQRLNEEAGNNMRLSPS